MKREGKVVWFTGQSGAGKTTIVKELLEGYVSISLDGNDMRESISLGAGFSKKDRREHNLRIARLAEVLSRQDIIVFVSVIAPMEEVRKEITKICNPTWIYVKRTIPERKGHFYEEPKGIFTLDHDELSINESVVKVENYLGDIICD